MSLWLRTLWLKNWFIPLNLSGLEQLKDWVPLDADSDETPRIRPAHPVTALQGAKKRRRAAVKEYTWYVGDRVDAWIDYR